MDTLLATFIRDGTLATVIDINLLKLGSAGSLNAARLKESEESPWYRYLMEADTGNMPAMTAAQDHMSGEPVRAALEGNARAQWALSGARRAAADGRGADLHRRPHPGAVVLQQAGDQLLALRDDALTRLFNLTLIATAAAVIIMFGFASWISLRIGRLRNAADSAVGSDGKIRSRMPDSGRSDEIGELSRGFERLLSRLNEHTQYLRTLGASCRTSCARP